MELLFDSTATRCNIATISQSRFVALIHGFIREFSQPKLLLKIRVRQIQANRKTHASLKWKTVCKKHLAR